MQPRGRGAGGRTGRLFWGLRAAEAAGGRRAGGRAVAAAARAVCRGASASDGAAPPPDIRVARLLTERSEAGGEGNGSSSRVEQLSGMFLGEGGVPAQIFISRRFGWAGSGVPCVAMLYFLRRGFFGGAGPPSKCCGTCGASTSSTRAAAVRPSCTNLCCGFLKVCGAGCRDAQSTDRALAPLL